MFLSVCLSEAVFLNQPQKKPLRRDSAHIFKFVASNDSERLIPRTATNILMNCMHSRDTDGWPVPIPTFWGAPRVLITTTLLTTRDAQRPVCHGIFVQSSYLLLFITRNLHEEEQTRRSPAYQSIIQHYTWSVGSYTHKPPLATAKRDLSSTFVRLFSDFLWLVVDSLLSSIHMRYGPRRWFVMRGRRVHPFSLQAMTKYTASSSSNINPYDNQRRCLSLAVDRGGNGRPGAFFFLGGFWRDMLRNAGRAYTHIQSVLSRSSTTAGRRVDLHQVPGICHAVPGMLYPTLDTDY